MAYMVDKEADDLDRAIEESRRDYYTGQGNHTRGTETSSSTTEPETNPRRTRDPRNDVIILRLGVEVLQMNFEDGDTLVLIDAPPRLKDQTLSSYAQTAAHYCQYHRIHSQKLLETGSKVFERLLSVDKQTRQLRTLKKFFPNGKPDGIKYVLDVRPPSEDEEAILLVTELSCTHGVLVWHKVGPCFGVSPLLINGKDDIEHLPALKDVPIEANDPDLDGLSTVSEMIPSEAVEQTTTSSEQETAPIKQASNEESSNSVGKDQPSLPQADQEYSPIRHRSAIERVLSAIEHQDPRLDSAPKVWKYFAVAKHFECATHERVSGWITKWIFAFPNNNFIQCNPEVCYRIGLGINCYDLTRDAFSILVGEQALMRVHSHGHAISNLSVHGRVRENLDDDEQNRVSHAASQLVTRMQDKFRDLLNVEAILLQHVPEYGLVRHFEPRNGYEQAVKNDVILQICGYVRMRILAALYRTSAYYMPYHILPAHLGTDSELITQNLTGCSAYNATYYGLTGEERIFTRTFWIMLGCEDFANSYFPPEFAGHVAEKCWALLSPSFPDVAPLPMASYDSLMDSFERFNQMRHESLQALQEQYAFDTEVPYIAPDFHSIRLLDILEGVNSAMRQFTTPITEPPHLWHIGDRLPTGLIDTLMCLADEEWKYLPLWAGGNDDGTGGVFDETDVPILEAGGFSTPGPKVHTGMTPAVSVDGSSSSDFTETGSQAISTAGKASGNATDGTITTESMKSFNTISDNVDMAATTENMDGLWTMIRQRTGNDSEMSDFTSTIGSSSVDNITEDEITNDYDMDDDDDDDDDDDTVEGQESEVDDFEHLELSSE